MTNDQITSIYCRCFDLTQALGIQDDPQCKMNTAEVMIQVIVKVFEEQDQNFECLVDSMPVEVWLNIRAIVVSY